MPYSRILTDFRDMSNRPFNGTMLAVLGAPIELPEGTQILNQRFEYPIKAGVAYDDATYTVFAELPATATAIPADTQVSIFLKDASGRLFYHGAFVIPEMTSNQPVPLASLTNNDPVSGVVFSVKTIGGLTGDVTLSGQVSVDQATNTLTFHGLRFKGPWDGDSTFADGDVVRYDNDLYVAIRPNQGVTPEPGPDWSLFLEQPPVIVPEPTGIRWRGTWQTGVLYDVLDAVEYQGSSYVCILTHQSAASTAPSDGSARWDLFAQRSIGITWKGAWDPASPYARSDAVSYQGASYLAITDVPANMPPGTIQQSMPAGNVASPTGGSTVGTTSAPDHGSVMAFDGDPNTYWEAATGSGYYNTVGLANVWGGVLREVTSLIIRQHATDYRHKIGSLFVQYTQDTGATWHDAAAGALMIPGNGFGEQTVSFPTPVMANGMRIKANAGTTAGGSSYPWRIYELKFLADALESASYWELIAAQGDPGPPGPPGAGMTWRGAWEGASVYAVGDAVSYNGESWLCIQANTNQPPAEDGYWDRIAAKGFDGQGSATSLDGLTDVTIANPAAKHTLVHDGTAFKNRPLTLADLADVDLGGEPSGGSVLEYDATSATWKPGTDDAASAAGGVTLLVAATRTTNQALTANGAGQATVVFDSTSTNVGAAYNTSTGRFTAPSAGEYLFAAHLEIKRDAAGSNNIGAGLVKNTEPARWQGKYPQSGELAWQAAQEWAWRVTLAAGDTVDIVARSAQASTIQADGASQGSLGTSRCALKVYKLT